MPRLTEAQKLQNDLELNALEFFERILGKLPDPRRKQGTRYPLRTIVVTALIAMVAGADDAEAMQSFGEENNDWLSGFLDMPHGAPTQDVFLDVFAALEPEAFNAVFRAWADLLRLRMAPEGKHIAIDGKTSRRSFDRSKDRPAVHTVSAWMIDAGLVLGQKKTADKSNEITAIPELLRVLDLRGATVTIDAMGCQTEIASTIIEREGHYLLAVKENQPTLHQDLERLFVESDDDRRRSVDELARPKVERVEEIDKGHGRIEKRTVRLCRDLDWLTAPGRWAGLSTAVEIRRERTVLRSGKQSTEVAYYIGSNSQQTAAQAGASIRRHWGIETQLHWVLDMAFREDDARHRAKNAGQNFSTLRHFALNIIRQDRGRKLGVANTRKRAAWSRTYLIKLLTRPES